MVSKKRDLKKPILIGLIAVILAYHAATNIAFILIDKRPGNINELSHVMGAIDFVNLLSNQPDKRAAYLVAFSGYPPAGIAASAAYALLGRTHDSAQYSQLVFSVIAVIFLFLIGEKLFDKTTGVLAAAFFIGSPAVCEVSRQYLLEWPLTAMTIIAVYFIWRSEAFASKNYSYAAGLAVGLAALCKQTFIVFLAGPLLVVFIMWIRLLMTGEKGPRSRSYRFKWLVVLLALCAGPALAWFLYPLKTRQAIDVWFALSAGREASWGMGMLIMTSVLASASALLFACGKGPLLNGVGAGFTAALTASLWYFPKGIGNWLTYAGQMKMNVATMSPAHLMQFYESHLTSYYLGVLPCFALAAAAAMALILLFAGKSLSRHFYRAKSGQKYLGVAYIFCWLALPAVAFFFINIQNEMNTVPIVAPMALLQAFVTSRLFLPYSKRRIADMKAGRRPPAGARLIRALFAACGIALAGMTIASGLLTSFIFSDGRGGYRELPLVSDPVEVSREYFPRKHNTLNYLVPNPKDWQVDEISDRVLENVKGKIPRLLSMDVNFYFSWNTFWYEFKLRNREVIVATQWDDDADILNNVKSSDHISKYDAIVYREPWREVYEASKNDYIDYKNLWETYEYISDAKEFMSDFFESARYKLPDDTTAILLFRK